MNIEITRDGQLQKAEMFKFSFKRNMAQFLDELNTLIATGKLGDI